MGLCASLALSPQKEEDEKQEPAYVKAFKLLMLGTGDSGKTTIYKQLTQIYGGGFSERHKRLYRAIIKTNILESTQTLLRYHKRLTEGETIDGLDSTRSREKDSPLIGGFDKDQKGIPSIDWNEDLLHARRNLLSCDHHTAVDEQLGMDIALLWKQPALKFVFERRDQFHIQDSAAYFLNKAEQLTKEDYIPTVRDILLCRSKTTEITTGKFEIANEPFEVVDVGGQRNERKKWVHHFRTCKALLFIVSLNDYTKVLEESKTTNSMLEAIELFDQVSNSRWFTKTPIVLLLNKDDLFREKLKRIPITECEAFRSFEGDANSYPNVSKYIANYFLKLGMTGERRLYIHFTCATDEAVVKPLFDSMKDSVLEETLEGAIL
eukprot:CAMPEP_0114487932 /NCGR_PEP_ID=MMETSP0109-20121206/1044_1 /TAXON_ID=29199 /ORGANISM="Chlorarachnion reptans, Strain CCCM449" /LENGTH=377 /DNA_ID=CAMNT_0001664259 /DNA_START=6 /DNA_END=1139 /DNA_ORIENTATION=-